MSTSDENSRLRNVLYGYLPGREDDTIKELRQVFNDEGYRKLKKRLDPDDQWRENAKVKNNKLINKYAKMEGLK